MPHTKYDWSWEDAAAEDAQQLTATLSRLEGVDANEEAPMLEKCKGKKRKRKRRGY